MMDGLGGGGEGVMMNKLLVFDDSSVYFSGLGGVGSIHEFLSLYFSGAAWRG